ncbi:MAG: hypothetical protein ABIF77_16180 [bacterium]
MIRFPVAQSVRPGTIIRRSRRHAVATALLGFVVAVLGAGPTPVLASGPVFWDYPESIDFDEFELEGVARDVYGRLIAGLVPTEVLAGECEVVWQTIPDGDGGLYAGTGHSGEIWHQPRNGEAELLVTLPEPEIFCLLKVGDFLYAGGGPDGLLYRIDRSGEAEIWADLPEGYIWAMDVGSKQQLYLATGAPAAVYVVDGRHEVKLLTRLAAANALDLVRDENGALLVATQGPGLLYRIDPHRPKFPEILFETTQEEIRQFAAGPAGQWFFLAVSRQDDLGDISLSVQTLNGGGAHNGGGNGQDAVPEPAALYRLDPDGLVSQVWSDETNLLAVAYSRNWGWLGAGMIDRAQDQAALLVLTEPAGSRTIATWEAGDVLDIVVEETGGGHESVIACLAHPGRVVRLEEESEGSVTAISPPLDGGAAIRWRRLRWEGSPRAAGNLEFSVRSGARSTPDETWSEWSESWRDQDHALDVSPSRFLQWRVLFKGKHPECALAAVTVSGVEPNRPPVIYEFVLEPAGEISLGGLMSHEENVTETFRSGLKAEYNLTSRKDTRADLFKAEPTRPLRTFMWLAHDPNDDRLQYQLEYQRIGEQTWRPVSTASHEMVGSWDTATVPDGTYVVRLTASDRPDNPRATALTTSKIGAPLQVDNSPPRISNFSVKRTVDGIRIEFKVADTISPLGEAWLELPNGDTERLDPRDGVCDSQEEQFAAEVVYPGETKPAPPEPWRVRVVVSDRLGNVVAEEGELE